MAERGTIGEKGGGAGYGYAGWTHILASYPAQARGIMRTFGINIRTTGNFKIKIFRDDGTNYVFITEKSFYLVAGDHIEEAWGIAIEKNDLIGHYSADGTHWAGYVDSVYKSGDIVTTTPKSGWSYPSYRAQLLGHIFGKGGYIL